MKLLTRNEAAAYLKVSLRTLDTWKNKGYLSYYELGLPGRKKLIRFTEEDLDAVMKHRAEAPEQQGLLSRFRRR